MSISDWSADVGSSDLRQPVRAGNGNITAPGEILGNRRQLLAIAVFPAAAVKHQHCREWASAVRLIDIRLERLRPARWREHHIARDRIVGMYRRRRRRIRPALIERAARSEEKKSELQSLMRISY